MKPEMEAIEIQTKGGLLCGSITQDGNNLNILLMAGEEFGDNETIN